jgi:hypothetical protein
VDLPPSDGWDAGLSSEMLVLDLSEREPDPDQLRRRKLTAVAAAIVAVVLLAAGAGYLAFRGPGRNAPRKPAAEAPLVPAPARPAAAVPARLPSPVLARPATTATRLATTATAAPPAVERTATPSIPAAPPGTFAAGYRYVADLLKGYTGTVRITNSSGAAASGWTVRLTVPLTNTVTVHTGAVTMSREGPTIVFTPAPAAAPVAAHGSVTFSFELAGALSALPTGCTIDGDPCT